MLLSESLAQAENIIILESYMDLEKLYGDTLNNINPDELKYAYNMVQTNKEIKNLVKKNLNLGLGGLEKAIVIKYPSPVDFINSVFQAKDNLEKNKAVQDQKNQDQLKRQNELKENETEDFYIIPCRTFEQAHKAAFSHTGNLLLMSNQKIKETYHINVPEPAQFYKTDKTPAEMLEFMRQAPFFMNPTWCIAANKNYWDYYRLNSEEGEPCLCYIIISKQHPNVRFCIVKSLEDDMEDFNERIITNNTILSTGYTSHLAEFRDAWQASLDPISYGTKVFQSIKPININTFNKIKKLCSKTETSRLLYSADLKYCNNNFDDNTGAFAGNEYIEKISADFPTLVSADGMFSECDNLKEFRGELPILENGNIMFLLSNIKTFIVPSKILANLKFADMMFQYTAALNSFIIKLPKLESGFKMFEDCQLDEKSILAILTSIPEYKEDEHRLTLGRNINFKNSKQIAALLGITTPIQPGEYNYKGWEIEISD